MQRTRLGSKYIDRATLSGYDEFSTYYTHISPYSLSRSSQLYEIEDFTALALQFEHMFNLLLDQVGNDGWSSLRAYETSHLTEHAYAHIVARGLSG